MTGFSDDRLARARDRELGDLLQDLEFAFVYSRGRFVRPLLKEICDRVWRLRDQLREGK